MEDPAYMELHFAPSVMLVNVVRRFVSEFYRQFLRDADAVSRLALVTHELLENAVKYSVDGKTTIRIEVAKTPSGRAVQIRLTNCATDDHIATIQEIVDGIAVADDPFTYYQDLIVRNARREGSGLGLARISAEAEMKLAYRIEGTDRVVIEATAELPEGAA